jgi:hypothetical protein
VSQLAVVLVLLKRVALLSMVIGVSVRCTCDSGRCGRPVRWVAVAQCEAWAWWRCTVMLFCPTEDRGRPTAGYPALRCWLCCWVMVVLRMCLGCCSLSYIFNVCCVSRKYKYTANYKKTEWNLSKQLVYCVRGMSVGCYSSTPTLLAATDITRTQNTNCCLCSASWRWERSARNMYRPLIHYKLNKKVHHVGFTVLIYYDARSTKH